MTSSSNGLSSVAGGLAQNECAAEVSNFVPSVVGQFVGRTTTVLKIHGRARVWGGSRVRRCRSSAHFLTVTATGCYRQQGASNAKRLSRYLQNDVPDGDKEFQGSEHGTIPQHADCAIKEFSLFEPRNIHARIGPLAGNGGDLSKDIFFRADKRAPADVQPKRIACGEIKPSVGIDDRHHACWPGKYDRGAHR